MSFKHKQIIDLFTNTEETMWVGLWFTGVKGEGELKSWWNNGQLHIHSFYKNGMLDGEHKAWLKNGALINHKLFKNDRAIKDYL